MTRFLHPAALGLVLLLPWFLLHARAAVDASIALIAAAFLATSLLNRGWQWLRTPWFVIALAWWAWLVTCTAANAILHGGHGPELLQAALVLRFLVFAAALEHWVLATPATQRWLLRSLSLATLYVAAQVLLQFATGHNLFGTPRSGDGELTGPFTKPRAAPSFVRMLFPALLPAAASLLARPTALHKAAAALLCAAAAITVVLIGQRMPVLLAVLGLVASAALLPRFRLPVAAALLAGSALIAASAAVAPPPFYRLVTKFSHQVENFGSSPYGLIAERSAAIGEAHPWIGLGYDGFRAGCPDSQYFHPWHWPGIPPSPGAAGGAEMCVTHPHNHYGQALVDAGIPGLLLFCALVATWFTRLARGLLRNPDPLRIGLFVAALLQEWPIASTSPLVSVPIGAWFFLLLGFGLALAPAAAAKGLVHRPQHPVEA